MMVYVVFPIAAKQLQNFVTGVLRTYARNMRCNLCSQFAADVIIAIVLPQYQKE